MHAQIHLTSNASASNVKPHSHFAMYGAVTAPIDYMEFNDSIHTFAQFASSQERVERQNAAPSHALRRGLGLIIGPICITFYFAVFFISLTVEKW